MSTLKKQKKQKDLLMDFDSIFDGDDSEDIKFEEMVINSEMMAVINDLMTLNNIKSKAELANKLNVTPAYISKLFSGDKTFNVPLLAKMQRIFKTRFVMNARSLVAKQTLGKTFDSTKINSKIFNIQGDCLEGEYHIPKKHNEYFSYTSEIIDKELQA